MGGRAGVMSIACIHTPQAVSNWRLAIGSNRLLEDEFVLVMVPLWAYGCLSERVAAVETTR